jgi:hypothetical protein
MGCRERLLRSAGVVYVQTLCMSSCADMNTDGVMNIDSIMSQMSTNVSLIWKAILLSSQIMQKPPFLILGYSEAVLLAKKASFSFLSFPSISQLYMDRQRVVGY